VARARREGGGDRGRARERGEKVQLALGVHSPFYKGWGGGQEGDLMAGELRRQDGIPMLDAGRRGVAGGSEMRRWGSRDHSAWGRG
jgi:hypothetical protein